MDNKKDVLYKYKTFYVNRFAANKNVYIKYFDEALNDFFNKYPFDSKDVKDYPHDLMEKHIVFDLCRIIGDSGFNIYSKLMDYVYNLYIRDDIQRSILIAVDNLKLNNVN